MCVFRRAVVECKIFLSSSRLVSLAGYSRAGLAPDNTQGVDLADFSTAIGGCMTSHNRRIDDVPASRRSEGRRPAATIGTILFATALGVGLGLLAAPEPGVQTRKRLKKRLTELGEDFGEGFEEAQEISGRARKRVRKRLAQLSEDLGEALEEAQQLGGK